jgi:hypothetical protein
MVTDEELANVITGMAQCFNDELYSKTESELEENWFFEWDNSASLEENTYNFYDMLKLYGNFCRRWEEKHNGSICVVERVRDKYLMPKIREFVRHLTTACTRTDLDSAGKNELSTPSVGSDPEGDTSPQASR